MGYDIGDALVLLSWHLPSFLPALYRHRKLQKYPSLMRRRARRRLVVVSVLAKARTLRATMRTSASWILFRYTSTKASICSQEAFRAECICFETMRSS